MAEGLDVWQREKTRKSAPWQVHHEKAHHDRQITGKSQVKTRKSAPWQVHHETAHHDRQITDKDKKKYTMAGAP